MAVDAVFVSSVILGFEEVREAAAGGVRAVGMHAVRSEELSANPATSRRALLDQVSRSDYYLLLLGQRYGDYAPGQPSPTEEEYAEAVRLGKPIFVLVQQTSFEPRQQEFLDQVRGTWSDGVFYGKFEGAGDVGSAVAAALARHQSGVIEDGPAAKERALTLASEGDPRGSAGGVSARIAFVPLRRTVLVDAVALDEPNLAEKLAADVRSAGAVPQSVGIEAEVSSQGIRLTGNASVDWTTPCATIGVDGAITVGGSVSTDQPFGLSSVDPERLRELISRAGAATKQMLGRIDQQEEIGRLAVAAAVHGASYKGYGSPSGSSMQVSMSLPDIVRSPAAEIVPRVRLDDPAVARRIEAGIKRIFADAGAVQR
jgi:Domain of unknown function (DUF4062)